MQAGARGYLLKGALKAKVFHALRGVAAGEAYITERAPGAPAISLKTAPNHVSNILSKLQVADRAAAIVRARDAGMR
jgi:DNA-binding NarL/FixJ family response regulator